MTLTFRTSTPEQRVVIEREPDGRQRVATATRNSGSHEHWDLKVTHPSGQNWNGTFNGSGVNVTVALAEMLARTQNEFRDDKARGDRPHRDQLYDWSRRVDEHAVAPIRPNTGRR